MKDCWCWLKVPWWRCWAGPMLLLVEGPTVGQMARAQKRQLWASTVYVSPLGKSFRGAISHSTLEVVKELSATVMISQSATLPVIQSMKHASMETTPNKLHGDSRQTSTTKMLVLRNTSSLMTLEVEQNAHGLSFALHRSHKPIKNHWWWWWTRWLVFAIQDVLCIEEVLGSWSSHRSLSVCMLMHRIDGPSASHQRKTWG